MFSSIATKYGFEYPLEKLNEGWQMILTNQFHDSLPGSHITEVFGDLCDIYKKIIAIGEEVLSDALNAIAGNSGVKHNLGKPFALFNALSKPASNKVELPFKNVEIFDADGNRVPTQSYVKLDGTKVLVFVAKDVPAAGFKVYYAKDGAVSEAALSDESALDSKRFSLKFNDRAELVSLYDKANSREVLSGTGNVFRIYEDLPGKYDAWDIVATYVDREFETKPGKIESIKKAK